MNTEWLQRLAPYDDLSVLCSSFSVRDLFGVGIQALKECFDGVIVTSLIDVFALMHIACASAYMLHRDDESYCWDNLLDDMLVWQYAIINESEVLLFVEVMNKLSIPQGILKLSSKASNLYNWSSRGALLAVLRNGRVMKDCWTMLASKLFHEPPSTPNYSRLRPISANPW